MEITIPQNTRRTVKNSGPLKLSIMWGMLDLCTLAWPCVGIHHGLDNHGAEEWERWWWEK